MQKILMAWQENFPPEAQINQKLIVLGQNWKIVSQQTIVSFVPCSNPSCPPLAHFTITLVVEYEERDISSLTLEQVIPSSQIQDNLKDAGISSLKDLLFYTEEELRGICGFRKTDLRYIKRDLALRRLHLKESLESKSITELGLSIRAMNCLDDLGIKNILQLVDKTEDDLLAVRNFGQTCLDQVTEVLAKNGLKLKEPKY